MFSYLFASLIYSYYKLIFQLLNAIMLFFFVTNYAKGLHQHNGVVVTGYNNIVTIILSL